MSDTIHYEGKIKRGKDPVEVFQKISRGIKKKGPTKDWVCVVDEEEEYLRITFSGNSEDFVLHFDEKGAFYDFCKVDFLDREDGTDEFHALIDAIYSAKSMFSRIELTDDYGLAEEYWDSKRFKIKFRELTQEEKDRALWGFHSLRLQRGCHGYSLTEQGTEPPLIWKKSLRLDRRWCRSIFCFGKNLRRSL